MSYEDHGQKSLLFVTCPPNIGSGVMLEFSWTKGGGYEQETLCPEQIISMLREAEVIQSKGSTVIEACHKLGISEQTYYRWRKEYGGMRVDQAKRLK